MPTDPTPTTSTYTITSPRGQTATFRADGWLEIAEGGRVLAAGYFSLIDRTRFANYSYSRGWDPCWGEAEEEHISQVGPEVLVTHYVSDSFCRLYMTWMYAGDVLYCDWAIENEHRPVHPKWIGFGHQENGPGNEDLCFEHGGPATPSTGWVWSLGALIGQHGEPEANERIAEYMWPNMQDRIPAGWVIGPECSYAVWCPLNPGDDPLKRYRKRRFFLRTNLPDVVPVPPATWSMLNTMESVELDDNGEANGMICLKVLPRAATPEELLAEFKLNYQATAYPVVRGASLRPMLRITRFDATKVNDDASSPNYNPYGWHDGGSYSLHSYDGTLKASQRLLATSKLGWGGVCYWQLGYWATRASGDLYAFEPTLPAKITLTLPIINNTYRRTNIPFVWGHLLRPEWYVIGRPGEMWDEWPGERHYYRPMRWDDPMARDAAVERVRLWNSNGARFHYVDSFGFNADAPLFTKLMVAEAGPRVPFAIENATAWTCHAGGAIYAETSGDDIMNVGNMRPEQLHLMQWLTDFAVPVYMVPRVQVKPEELASGWLDRFGQRRWIPFPDDTWEWVAFDMRPWCSRWLTADATAWREEYTV